MYLFTIYLFIGLFILRSFYIYKVVIHNCNIYFKKLLKSWLTWSRLGQARKFIVNSKFEMIFCSLERIFHGDLWNSGELYLLSKLRYYFNEKNLN